MGRVDESGGNGAEKQCHYAIALTLLILREASRLRLHLRSHSSVSLKDECDTAAL